MNAAQPTFFEMFLRDTAGDIELRRMVWQAQNGTDGRYTQPVSIVSRNLADLLKFSENGGGDIFLGINTRKPGVINAQKEEICEIACIATDVDFKSVSKPAFERALLSFPHKPTLIIDSGNGRHLYWILLLPILVQGPKEIELGEGISKGIAKHFGGDSTHDVTRILRVPGRANSKYIHKPICTIIAADGPRYSVEDLKRYWIKPESNGGKAKLGTIPDELPEKFQALLAKNRRVKDTWNGERPDLGDQSGSGYDLSMASLLVRQGFSDNEIAAVLRRMPSGKGREASDAYLSHTISKARQGAEQKTTATEQQIKKPLFEIMTDIQEEDVDWLWDKRLARGKLGLFDGDPEVGKSYAALAIAADLSNGSALPFDREPEAPLRSLIISAEDGAGDTLKPRLKMLGADMSMIAIPNRDLQPSIDANFIARILEDWPAALCVIDPVIAFARGRNTDKATDVRGMLGPLVSIAEKKNVAVVLIRHLNKNEGGKALYRGQGSIDFPAICRSVFAFAVDSATPGRRLMAHIKNSLSAKQRTLEYFIDDTGRFSWGVESDETADEALGAGEPKSKREAQQLEAAKAFLHQTLSNGPMPSGKVKERAESAGIANKTLWRAKEELDVKASKERGSMTGEWWWRLP